MSTRFRWPSEILPTHRVLQRWAVSIGSGLPSDQWDESRRSNVPPLDDATAVVVDQIHCHQPAAHRKLVREWYLGCGSSIVIASRRGISRRWLYALMHEALYSYRAAFQASGHRDLVALLQVREVFFDRAS